MDYILRIEGVNIVANVFATNDISVVRGTSLTYEAAAQQMAQLLAETAKSIPLTLDFETVFAGASQTAFLIRGMSQTDVQNLQAAMLARLEQSVKFNYLAPEFDGDIPTQHVTFAAGYAPVGTGEAAVDDALAAAQSQVRLSQMTRRTIIPPAPLDMSVHGITAHEQAICVIDQARPLGATSKSEIPVRQGQYPNGFKVRDLPNDSKDILVSERTADLRRFGQTARYKFYEKMFREHNVTAPPDLSDVSFAQSFEELVEKPPKAKEDPKSKVSEDLPVSLQNKVAYLYFDGTGWGAAAAQMGVKALSKQAHKLFVGKLLYKLVDLHITNKADPRYAIELWDSQKKAKMSKLRFETLMMGGEDWCLTVPAWNAFSLVKQILSLVDDSFEPLKLRCGALICSYKMPVRQAREIAYQLCDKARVKGENSAQFHIIESIEVPDGGIDEQRQRLYGTSRGEDFTFSLAELSNCRAAIAGFKKTLPRSQIYKSIRKIDTDGLGLAQAVSSVQLKDSNDPDWWMGLPKSSLGGSFPLKLLADYWDYADPFYELDTP